MEVRVGRSEAFHAFEENLARRVDFFLAGEEEEDVALGFGEVDLHHGDQRRVLKEQSGDDEK